MRTDVVHPTPLVDLVEVDGGAVVLVESGDRARVLKVSAMALTLLDVSQGGATLSAIGLELSARFGAPSNASIDDAVSTLVEELARQGLVEVQRGP